jgi:hypothetical protein
VGTQRVRWVLAGGLLLVACSGAQPAPEGGSDSFEALRAREVALPEPQAIAAGDGSFRAQVSGRPASPLQQTEIGWFGSYEIGTEQAIQCLFFAQTKDVAASLQGLVEGYVQELARNHALSGRRVLAVRADAVGAHPYLGVDQLLVLDSLAQQVKFRLANKGDRALSCLHPETGYEGAFEAFFRGLLETYAGAEAEPPRFREVSLLRSGGQTFGYRVLRVGRERAGAFEIVSVQAALATSADGVVVPSDTLLRERSKADGTLDGGLWVASVGEALTRVELASEGGGPSWRVRGEVSGIRVDRAFRSRTALLSWAGEVALLLQLDQGEGSGEASYLRWAPGVDLAAPTACQARSQGPGRVEVAVRGEPLRYELDTQGIARTVVGGGRPGLEIDRVHAEGAL